MNYKINQSSQKVIKNLNLAATVVSVVVLVLVASMRKIHIDAGDTFKGLPAIYSTLNALCAVFLIAAIYYVKQKNIVMHSRMIYIALTLSAAFLLMYVLYHITTPETKYCKEDFKMLYYTLLGTHILTAAGGFPFILFTFVRGFTGQIERHKKLSRWVFWVWLYVSVTGPIVYLMLKSCY
jgi:putative membrane protein